MKTRLTLINLTLKATIAATTLLLFSACNGPVEPDEQSIVNLEKQINVNQATDLILYFPNDEITNIQWLQTSGPVITFLASTSKVIAFTPTEIGEYQFSVSFNLNGQAQQITHTLTVLDESNLINARLGHAVLEQNKVSFRAEITSEVQFDSIHWHQLSGPEVDFTEDDLAMYFDAPSVSEDTLMKFEVKGYFNSEFVSDVVSILVEDSDNIANNAYFNERIATTYAYNQTSPYVQTIVDCVYSNQLTSSCSLATLPLIAQQSLTPSIDDIMDRVVVSHQWMGDRFKDFLLLNDSNDDFKNLLRATTAIVISYDVRPSFYWAATGAIYLDANNFWLTPDERDTINEAPDYRASFGNKLLFTMPWRYVKDNNYANSYLPDNLRITRDQSDGLYRLASLMYHELAHANDFFPKTEWFSHDQNTRILDAALSNSFESDELAIAYPLAGDEMYALAQVSFSGETANDLQKSYTPNDIKTFFSPEVANDYYNYSSPREDYAMLFEELMMQSRYDVYRDTAVTNLPSGENISIRDYIVSWGQCGRIGEQNIKPRVEFVTSRILPEFDSSLIIENLPTPIAMIEGNDWLENLAISPIDEAKASKNSAIATNDNVRLKEMNNQRAYYHKALPTL